MKYLSTTEVAQEIRAMLKKTFPRTKFAVRSSKYSGGSSISVNWTDGPSAAQVSPIVKRFEGSSFDGMIDLKTYNGPSLLNGEAVTFGVDYVFTNRETSAAKQLEVSAIVCKKLDLDIDAAAAIRSNAPVYVYLDINRYDTDTEFGLSFDEVIGRTYKSSGGREEWLSSVIHQVCHYISYEFSAPPESLPQDVDTVLQSIEALCA